jgi:putative transposase
MSKELVVENKAQSKALKIRIYPDKAQKEIIEKTFGCCRFIYNNYLQEKSEFYINNILPIKKTATKEEKSKVYQSFKRTSDAEYGTLYPWMKETSSSARHEAIRHLDSAYNRFFDNCKKQRKVGKRKNQYGFPQFKSKKDNHQSYSDRITGFNFFSKTITIPKCGKVKFSCSDLPKWWKFKTKMNGGVTISRTPAGKYYASILFTVENVNYEVGIRKDAIGLDFSPPEFYIDSNGKSGKDFGYIAQKQKYAKKLRKLQRSFAKKQNIKDENSPRKFPSKNKVKARIKLARFEEKIANKRRDFIEKETLRLVRNYDKVVVEDLSLKGISSFLRNAKNMNDTSWATFVTRLQQKGKDYHCDIIKADRYFPSSQLCSKCGWQYHGLMLSEREWTCPKCGTHHIRDINAAINLKNYVPKELRKLTPVEDTYVASLASLALQATVFNETGSSIGDLEQKVLAL